MDILINKHSCCTSCPSGFLNYTTQSSSWSPFARYFFADERSNLCGDTTPDGDIRHKMSTAIFNRRVTDETDENRCFLKLMFQADGIL